MNNQNSLGSSVVILALLLCGTPALASGPCKVTDPTGTPINTRDAQKNITGTTGNGRVVRVLRNGFDDAGKGLYQPSLTQTHVEDSRIG